MTNPIAVGQFSEKASFAHSHPNVVLAYTHGGQTYAALLRCSKLSITYGLISQESHARQRRAFYPHRRSQGNFALTFDFKGWREYQQAMTWFKNFARLALKTDNNQPGVVMSVSLPARAFTRRGIPTTGITFGDHTGSNVFSPTIGFVSVNDPNDPSTAVLSTAAARHEISLVDTHGADPLAVNFFYPDSAVNHPGKLDESLYGPTGAVGPTSSAGLQALLLNQQTGVNKRHAMDLGN